MAWVISNTKRNVTTLENGRQVLFAMPAGEAAEVPDSVLPLLLALPGILRVDGPDVPEAAVISPGAVVVVLDPVEDVFCSARRRNHEEEAGS